MSDPYANLGDAAPAMQEAIADAMQARAADPDQIAMRRAYLSEIRLPSGALAVEFGSGTGEVTRDLVDIAGATAAIGIEPGPVMVTRAQKGFADRADLSFVEGDAGATALDTGSVDLVAMHTLLCHVPDYDRVVAEAVRILRPGGTLAFFDGDYSTATCAIGHFDPLEAALRFMIDNNVHNLWIARWARPLFARHGLRVGKPRAHAYLAGAEPTYFRSVLERATTVMRERKLLSDEGADGLRAEMERRIARGTFFGFMSYISVLATKPEAAA